MEQISKNVFVETSFPGANVGVIVTSDGLIAVDTPECPGDALRWRDELSRIGPILYIINTEHHIDHTTGDYFLDAPVVATEWARDALLRPGAREKALERVLELWPETEPLLKNYELAIPTISFSGCLTLFVGDQTVHLVSAPGHTAGGLFVYVPAEGVVFTGDNIVYQQGPLFQEALPNEWLVSIKKIEALQPEIVVPGHGSVCDKSYIPAFTREVEECIGDVMEAIKRGLTKEEAMIQVNSLVRYEAYGVGLTPRRLMHQRNGVKRIYETLIGEIKEA